MTIERENAEIIALKAVTFIISDDNYRERFIALTGLDEGQIRENIAEPSFLCAALDFLLGLEKDLEAFATAMAIDPELPKAAKLCLEGETPWDSI